MIGRVLAIALNTYREQVRARVLFGMLGFAIATCFYSLLVATLSLHQEARVVADIGAASISLYSVLVAIVIGATSLHRELELKTVFPILTRRLYRHEYVLGKYLGTLATLSVFIAIDGGTVLALLAAETGQSIARIATTAIVLGAGLGIAMFFAKYTRIFVTLPWSFLYFAVMFVLCSTAGSDRRLVITSAILTIAEVSVVAAVAMLFSAFSSPFLTALFTLGVFLVGRSTDMLGNLPVRVFGETLTTIGRTLARIFPNLHVYVPPRPVLLGEVSDVNVWSFVGTASLQAALYATCLLVVSMFVFRKRDFQ